MRTQVVLGCGGNGVVTSKDIILVSIHQAAFCIFQFIFLRCKSCIFACSCEGQSLKLCMTQLNGKFFVRVLTMLHIKPRFEPNILIKLEEIRVILYKRS